MGRFGVLGHALVNADTFCMLILLAEGKCKAHGDRDDGPIAGVIYKYGGSLVK